MSGRITFSMIKPDAVKDGHSGAILKMIEEAGFRIVALKKTLMTRDLASKFYEIHAEKSFFETLVGVMTAGPIYVLIVEKDNAVSDYRKLIGSTNPANAEPGTIRKLFAKSLESNAVHGSDSDENAEIESNFFFAKTERF
ncbi:MAG TPA: nucleoside-diphosphate kinase [Cytophagales bacterium]|nr:nucleoside-diphosphate kinase [Cytophagales bacterium]